MSEKRDETRNGRRAFLKGVALGAGAVAAVRIAQGTAMAPGDGVKAAETSRRATRGYQETVHVRKYYETARI